ncbi:glycosyltransferase [Flavobacterium sp. AS60]|uniref:glycosyltransferase family 2 protein n=1 Tax=Flavobacterium anseongense TaxID=2910677 RepID=UPI001F3CD0BC|nr:glycosyltransferase [Flavobacterium sp. AS60]MCF6130448.1 glycosyltransferase [Flavobacterium sp. AS60]
MPRFSVIIPVFNKEKFVAKTIKSVLSQTFTDFEIIILNDGSTDKSEQEILSVTNERIHYFFKQNEGVAKARNFGIEKATGEYLCFLDADDYWYDNFLETMNQYIQKLPNEKVFASAIEIETGKKIIRAQYSFQQKGDYEIVNYFEASQKEAVLWTSSVCIHKEVFEKCGTFDEQLKISEDTDLWIRIGLQYQVVFIWSILARYVFDENSISRNLNYIFEDVFFEKYVLEEKKNQALKKYMDLNRFSTVIKHKLNENNEQAQKIYAEIDLKNLNSKKKTLLQLPSIMLKILLKLKVFMTNIGLGNSVFR